MIHPLTAKLIPFAFIAASIATATFTPSAHADWEGKFVASSNGKKKAEGRLYAKGGHFRVDVQEPFEVSLYTQAGSKKIEAAIHMFHIRLGADSTRFQDQLPTCLSHEFSQCVQDLKLRKIGSEKCGGKTCEIFAGTPGKRGMKKLKVWHWTGESESILQRSILTRDSGTEIITEFSEIARTSHPGSFFSIPANYKNAGPLESFVEDFLGKAK